MPSADWISIIVSLGAAILLFFFKRELMRADETIKAMDERIRALENKTHSQDVAMQELSGRIDTVIEILTRVEAKL